MRNFMLKAAAFFGLVVSGLCFMYGIFAFWIGLLRLIVPGTFSKGEDPIVNLMFFLSGIGLTMVGWYLGKACNKAFKPETGPPT